MADISREQVKDWLSSQTVLDLAGLIKELEEDWGVSAAAPMAMATHPPWTSLVCHADIHGRIAVGTEGGSS